MDLEDIKETSSKTAEEDVMLKNPLTDIEQDNSFHAQINKSNIIGVSPM